MAEPIVDNQWGKVDWIDFTHNWREKDAEYLQSRSILRYQDAAARDASLTTPAVGQVIYNAALDRLEWKGASAWKGVLPMPANLAVPTDSGAMVHLAHSGAAGKGIQFTPADIKVTGPLDVLSGLAKVDATGLSIKVGAVTALLSTDAVGLVSDKSLKVPKIDLTGGTSPVLDATGKEIVAGTVTATALAVTNINMAGTLTGGILNGASGTIGGVAISSNNVASPGGFFSGSAVSTTAVGCYGSDATKAIIRSQSAPSVFRAGRIEVDDNVGLTGTVVNLNSPMAVRNKAIEWYDAGNVKRGIGYAVSVYSATDPGVANFPEGTIWFS